MEKKTAKNNNWPKVINSNERSELLIGKALIEQYTPLGNIKDKDRHLRRATMPLILSNRQEIRIVTE